MEYNSYNNIKFTNDNDQNDHTDSNNKYLIELLLVKFGFKYSWCIPKVLKLLISKKHKILTEFKVRSYFKEVVVALQPFYEGHMEVIQS